MQIELGAVKDVAIDDFVLCEYGSKKSYVYYVGIIKSNIDEDGDVEVEFLRKSEKIKDKFIRPKVEDIASVPMNNLKAKLTRSTLTGTTARTRDGFFFKEYFGHLNIR